MPNYCYLQVDLRCPNCDDAVTDLVWFQWGYSPGQLPQKEHIYRLGDPIRWRYCKSGGLFSWAYFRDENTRGEEANFGDPQMRDLVIRDSNSNEGWGECRSCSWPLGGAAIEIRDNIIQRAWIYKPGVFDHTANIYLIRDEGRMVPMSEWRDHLMPAVQGCSEWRLVVPYVENGFLHIPRHEEGD